jgi:polyvinyl alcohol dehydrogenase (cytochrome)
LEEDAMRNSTDRPRFGAFSLGLAAVLALSPTWARGDDDDPHDWPMFNRDPLGTRHNSAEKRLGPGNVADLQVLWRIPTDGLISGTPAVQGNTVYAGDNQGAFYAVDARTGELRWKTVLTGASVTASAIVLRGRVVIGDQKNGDIYGLDKDTGRVAWKVRPNPVGRPAIWGSGTRVGRYVAIGVASNDEGRNLLPPYVTRGSVVLLDPGDGRVLWQTFMISDADYANGASGCGVWSSPSYDEETDTVYVSTGNNYDNPATLMSDAMLALDADTGAIKWSNQLYPNDRWNFSHTNLGPDFDFGDSPQVYRLPDGRKVVSAAQKSGYFHVLDARTGLEIFPPGGLTQFLTGGKLGGFHTDSGVADGIVFAPGNYGSAVLGIPQACAVVAINPDGTERWRFKTTGPSFSGLALANGVVYFQPNSDPNLYALSTDTGAVLAKVQTGGSSGGPAIAHGRIFLGGGPYFVPGATGYLMAIGLR